MPSRRNASVYMAYIALLGYGRMGKMVEAAAAASGHQITAHVLTTDDAAALPPTTDVAIDFSVPTAAEQLCLAALAQGIPVVSGTTGWDTGAVRRYVEQHPGVAFLHATNMSVGVNVVFAINRLLAAALDGRGYDASLTETHHVHKLDAPSGTAITLAEGILERASIRSIREGEVVGLHEVRYDSTADTITLRHEAHDRTGFAEGAVLAAEFLIGKSGVFTMAEVLGLDRLAFRS